MLWNFDIKLGGFAITNQIPAVAAIYIWQLYQKLYKVVANNGCNGCNGDFTKEFYQKLPKTSSPKMPVK